MSSKNEIIVEADRIEGGVPVEIALDEIERNRYKIILPLSYDFRFFPVDQKGKVIPVSSVETNDIQTII